MIELHANFLWAGTYLWWRIFCSFVEISKPTPPSQDHVYVISWELPPNIPLQPTFALPPNPNVVPTLPIQPLFSNTTSIHSTYSFSYYFALYEHIDHELCEDPFVQILTFIPSMFRTSSSPCCYPWTTKGKTTKLIKITLRTWWPFHTFKLMNWPQFHEALTSLEGENLKKVLVFNYVSTQKNPSDDILHFEK